MAVTEGEIDGKFLPGRRRTSWIYDVKRWTEGGLPATRRLSNWPIREANDQRLVKVLIKNQHDNLSQTLFIFGLIKQGQLTLLHCLIVFGFRRYSPLTGHGR